MAARRGRLRRRSGVGDGALLPARVELLAPAPSARALDVAAGPGTLAIRLAPAVRELVALDFSERMQAELERAASAPGLVNLRAVVGDGQNLPFADELATTAWLAVGYKPAT
ncbi:MAG: methyltransferase domain-containing protein [Pseudomonadota bacterium]